MNEHAGLIRLYRLLLFLYPRSFRKQYGVDMVELLREQLDDESRSRVCWRAVVDLCLTVPTCHVEAHMNRKITPVFVLLVTAIIAGVAFAFVEGLLGAVVAVLGSGLAVVTWRRERPAAATRAATRWWLVLAIGITLLAIVITSTTIVGELNEIAWSIAAIAFLTSFVFIAAGVVLAFLQLGRRSSDLAA